MAILLTNDDGFNALGIQEIYQKLKLENDIKIVAPKNNCSGMSASITLKKDIHLEKVDSSSYIVDGTPADCSYLGLTSLFLGEISQVISGINLGANLGNDVLYSGTVGAALAGRGLKHPPIAISVASYTPLDINFISRLSSDLIEKIKSQDISSDILVNINIPDIAENQYRGIKVTKLNHVRPISFPKRIDESTRNPIFKIGPSGIPSQVPDYTDVHAVNSGYVSVSFLNYTLSIDCLELPQNLEIELNE